jgi:hypothetical protein
MKLTNKYNLPQTFMNVLDRPTYSKGKAHLSATELINSPRIVLLRKKYDEQITTDVSEMIWSIFGTAIHSVLEQGKDENHIVEQRLHTEIDGWHLSGAIDLQKVVKDGIEISDYKTVGAWSVMNEKVEWEQQLNIYAWLVERVKEAPVVKLDIVAIIRDWNRRDAQNRQGYPEAPVAVISINLWPMEERESFIRNLIHIHSGALFAAEAGEELPLCTPEQMWEKPTMYAVKKEGASRAKSVHEQLDDAEIALEKAGKNYQLEIRPGDRTRCSSFCPVSQWCDQYQLYKEEQQND